MVRWPTARAAASRIRELPDLSVGLHLDLGEWRSYNGRWSVVYSVAPLESEPAVAEAHRQLQDFHRLLGRDPTHLDSHQHVHKNAPEIAEALGELAADLGIPLRAQTPQIRFEGGFFARASDGSPMPELITPGSLRALLQTIPPGITELSCHPGTGRDSWSDYDRDRAQEVETLCHPEVLRAISDEGIELQSFAGAAALLGLGEWPRRV
jgi:predicted glycoside hydrolase/deacetylase ChbG (UPF0249 family)